MAGAEFFALVILNENSSMDKDYMRNFCIKKYFYTAFAAMFLLVGSLAIQGNTAETEYGSNVVKNASFEDGTTNWKIPADSAEVISGVSHSGKHSLKYTNTDSDRYILFTQEVNVKPGQRVSISAWVKGENLTGRGAGVFIQSYGNGEYLYGTFPDTIPGTFDWKKIPSAELVVPENATSTTVGVYLNRKVTGTAWFDDVEVRVETPPAFASYLQNPFYRNIVKWKDATPWEYTIHINPRSDWKKNSIDINHTLREIGGKVLLQATKKIDKISDTVKVSFIPPELSIGDYVLTQTIIDPNGEEHTTDQQVVHVVSQMPDVYVDQQGFTVVDGKRFFPLGLYLNTSYRKDEPKDEDLERIVKGGFNTITDYQYGDVAYYYYKDTQKGPSAYKDQIKMYMDRAAKHGLKVIYSLPHLYPGSHYYKNENETHKAATEYVKMVRDYPALLAWNTNDERRTTGELRRMYDLLQRLDPDHPTLHVQNHDGYMTEEVALTDIIAPDPYPVGHPDNGGNLKMTAKSTRTTMHATQSQKPKGVWVVPQIFDWHSYMPERETHQPSLDEMRTQAYQSLINGAKGLVFYSYFDLKYVKYRKEKDAIDWNVFSKRWEDVSKMGHEIKSLTDVILRDEKVLLSLPKNAEIEAGAWQDGDELLLMFANPYYEEKSITFSLPSGWEIKDANQGQIKSTFAAGKATFTLPSVGSGVFRLIKD